MTPSPRARRPSSVPVDVQPGWRVDRIPGKPPHRDGDDRVRLPLWLVRDGRHVADAELTLSLSEAEHLHAALCWALREDPPPHDAPDCRRGEVDGAIGGRR